MTVKEVALSNKEENMTIWVCPNLVKNLSVTPKPYECGLEYTSASYIPQYIAEKEVVKTYIEKNYDTVNGKLLCIIWKNI